MPKSGRPQTGGGGEPIRSDIERAIRERAAELRQEAVLSNMSASSVAGQILERPEFIDVINSPSRNPREYSAVYAEGESSMTVEAYNAIKYHPAVEAMLGDDSDGFNVWENFRLKPQVKKDF